MIVQRSWFAKGWTVLTGQQRRFCAVVFVLMVVGTILEALGVGLVIPLISTITHPETIPRQSSLFDGIPYLGWFRREQTIYFLLACLVAAFLVKAAFLGVSTWLQAKLAYEVQASLASRLLNAYLDRDWSFHLKSNSTHLTKNVLHETSMVATGVMLPLLGLLTEGMALSGLVGLLVWVNWMAAIVLGVVVGSCVGVFYSLTRKRILGWGTLRQRFEALRHQHAAQALTGAREIKMIGLEKQFVQKFDLENWAYANIAMKQATLQQLPRLWLEVLAVVSLSILVLVLVLREGPSSSSILPTIGLFGAAAFRVLPSVTRILSNLQGIRYALPSVEIVVNELRECRKTIYAAGNRATFREAIQLDNVSFAYPGALKPALSSVSLLIPAGSVIGIVGRSGAGKSTLIDTLLGLLQPTSGIVLVDGKCISTNIRGWQALVGYVPQTLFLVDDTISANIALGVPQAEVDDPRMRLALRGSQLEDFVLTLPEGVDTVVGERGVRLSGGQRQRIGIARALYRSVSLIIFDEATSSLDAVTEAAVLSTVELLKGNCTVIIVSHHPRALERCDVIYSIDSGRLTLVPPNAAH